MTCQNCRKGVEQKLIAIEGVSKVSVSLENTSAHFETKKRIDVAFISTVLGEKYTVDNLKNGSPSLQVDSKWKQLRPLFLIFGYVIAGSFLLSRGQTIAVFMQYFMGKGICQTDLMFQSISKYHRYRCHWGNTRCSPYQQIVKIRTQKKTRRPGCHPGLATVEASQTRLPEASEKGAELSRSWL